MLKRHILVFVCGHHSSTVYTDLLLLSNCSLCCCFFLLVSFLFFFKYTRASGKGKSVLSFLFYKDTFVQF